MKILSWKSPLWWGAALALPVVMLAQSPQTGPIPVKPIPTAAPSLELTQEDLPARLRQAPPPPAPALQFGPQRPGPDPQRDPTNVEPSLRPVLDPLAPPSAASSALPPISVKGRIVSSTKAAAVLDVAGQFYTVYEGSRIDTANASGAPFTLTVTKLSGRDAILKVEQLDRELRLP